MIYYFRDIYIWQKTTLPFIQTSSDMLRRYDCLRIFCQKNLRNFLIKTDFPHHLHRITWRMCFWSYNLITFLFYDQILVTNTHTVSNNRYERENSKNYPQRNRPDDNGAREACFLIFHIKRYNFQTYDEIMETSNERPWRTGSVYCKYQI